MRNGLYVIGALWLALVVLWPLDADREDAEATSSKTEQGLFHAELTQAPFGILDGDFYEATDGKKRWNIRSQFVELHRKENFAFMQDVEADFFAETTGNKIETKSQYGRSYLEKQEVDLEGKVTIRSRRGYLFEMDRLNYNGGQREFNTEDTVTIRGPIVAKPAMILKGTGMTGNIDAEHFVLRRSVVGQKQLKSSEWMRIGSRSGEFFTEEQRAVFVGNVRSTLPQVTIESDIFELNSTENSESIFARGNVVLRKKDTIGHAEAVSMEAGSTRIVLEGNARVDSKDNQLKGRRIVLYTDEDKVEVEGAEGKVRQ